jgi:hypothetical protein
MADQRAVRIETQPSRQETFLELKRALQILQSARLNDTYTDLKQDPQYEKIGDFFFNKLYGPEDFSFRDTSIKKLQKVLKGKIYRGVVSAVGLVIELHELTERLDNRMVEGMMAAGVGADLDMNQYRRIYRSLDNYDERIGQIELSIQATKAFYALSRKLIVKISLNTIGTTAHLLGMGRIFDFIYEGYTGFRAIRDIDYFVQTVQTRELAWHDDIWLSQSVVAK